ncbi:MAG: cryptochrome/photolyase family protein [Flavobacteriaceae bacterium]|nr:cryptochrome/photolyase family protein [Flavobacteriaceae bacterium]
MRVSDAWLEQRIRNSCKTLNIKIHEFESPLFLNSKKNIQTYFNSKKRLNQTDFYKHQRKSRKFITRRSSKTHWREMDLRR